jgi:hypothetical protein
MAVGLLMVLTLGSRSAHAQTEIGTPPPPARRHIVSVFPLGVAMDGLGIGLSYERVLTAHLSLSGRVFGGRRHFANGRSGYADFSGELGGAARWYFTGHAPHGFYGEVGVYGRGTYYQYDEPNTQPFRQLKLEPEAGLGYQFFIGRKQRFTGDLGMRMRATHYPASSGHPAEFSIFGVPTLRLGVAF